MTVFMRSPTWISSNAFGDSAMASLGLDPEGCKSASFTGHAVRTPRDVYLYPYAHNTMLPFTDRPAALESSDAGTA